jgi:heptosyltransferase-2
VKQLNPETTRRILVRAVNWVGDAVMTTPALGLIRENFPRAEITLLANPLVSQLLSPHPAVDRVITFHRNGVHGGIAGRFRLAGEIRKRNFDAAIILPNSFDSALVPWLAGIATRLGKSSDGRGFMLSGRYHPSRQVLSGHEVEYYCDLVRTFGMTGPAGKPLIITTPAEDRNAATTLAESGIAPGEFLLGINPGAAFGSAKRWYPERFAEVAGRLAGEWNARIIIFGGPVETEIAAAIEERLSGPGCLNMAGRTGMRELLALIRRCNFFITNDSGPMHIAAAFGVPLVAIFGPTDHTGTAPYSDRAVIVRKEFECAPCKLRVCPTDHQCMTAVTADDVVSAALGLSHQIQARQEAI